MSDVVLLNNMLLDKEHFKEILDCIQRNFENPHKFQEEMKSIALELFRETIYDAADIYVFGELLFQMVHIYGISVEIQ